MILVQLLKRFWLPDYLQNIGFLAAYEDASLTLSGGTLGGSLAAGGGSVVTLVGSDFFVDGVPVGYGPLSAESGRISGTLESGDALDADFTRDSGATITLVPEPGTAGLLALGLVVMVIFVFLRDWRTTLVPVVVIPVSLIGTFAVMNMIGFSINMLSLFGIVLAIDFFTPDAFGLRYYDSFNDLTLAGEWVFSVSAIAAIALVIPFHSMAGFALYLNRRIELEAWDIEISFRSIGRTFSLDSIISFHQYVFCHPDFYRGHESQYPLVYCGLVARCCIERDLNDCINLMVCRERSIS